MQKKKKCVKNGKASKSIFKKAKSSAGKGGKGKGGAAGAGANGNNGNGDQCGCNKTKTSKKKKTKTPKVFKAPKGWVNITGKGRLCIISAAKGGILTQGKCGKYSDALWKIKKIQKNDYIIVSKNGMALENKNGSNKMNNPIVSNKQHKQQNQRWTFHNVKGGKLMIENTASKKCVDVSKKAKAGLGYVQTDCLKGNDGEHFKFTTKTGKKIKTKKVSKKTKAKIVKKKLAKKVAKGKKKAKKQLEAKKLLNKLKPNAKKDKKTEKKIKKAKKVIKKKIAAGKPKEKKKLKKALKKIKKTSGKGNKAKKKVLKKTKKAAKKPKKVKALKKQKKKVQKRIKKIAKKGDKEKAKKLKKIVKKLKKKVKKQQKKNIKKAIKKIKKIKAAKGDKEKVKKLKKKVQKLKVKRNKRQKKAVKKLQKKAKKVAKKAKKDKKLKPKVKKLKQKVKKIKKAITKRKIKKVKKTEKKIVRLAKKGKKTDNLKKKVEKMKKSLKKKKKSKKAVKKIKKAKKIVTKKLKNLATKGKTEKAKLLMKVLKKMKKISKRVSKKPKSVIRKIKKAVKKAIHIEYKSDPTKAKKKKAALPKGILNIVGKTGLCIESGKKTIKSICGNKESMAWHLKKVGVDEYQIISDDGSMLTNKNGVNKSGNPIISVKSSGKKRNSSNIWRFDAIKNGQYIIFNPATKKCFDTTNKTNPGSGYVLKTCRSEATNENQLFSFNHVKPEKLCKIKSDPDILKLGTEYFNIQGAKKLCLKSTGEGSPLEQSKCVYNEMSLWRVSAVGENQFFIQNKAGFKLSLRNDAKHPKGIISNHLTLATELFTIKTLKAGKYMIKNSKVNKCIDTDGKPKESGVYKMFKCKAGDDGQSYKFVKPTTVKLAKGWINIIGANFLCLKNMGNGQGLTQSSCNDSAEMLWKFEVVKGNMFTITNKKDQSVIDLAGSKTFKGNGLVSFKRNNSKSQRWNVESIKKGQIILKSEASGRCLDAGKIKKGSTYRLWDCSKKAKGQQYRLQYARPAPPTKVKVVYRTASGKIVNKNGGKVVKKPKGAASKKGGKSSKKGGKSAKKGGKSSKKGGKSTKNGGKSAKKGGKSTKNGKKSSKKGGKRSKNSRKGKNGKKSKSNKKNIPKGIHIQSIDYEKKSSSGSTGGSKSSTSSKSSKGNKSVGKNLPKGIHIQSIDY